MSVCVRWSYRLYVLWAQLPGWSHKAEHIPVQQWLLLPGPHTVSNLNRPCQSSLDWPYGKLPPLRVPVTVFTTSLNQPAVEPTVCPAYLVHVHWALGLCICSFVPHWWNTWGKTDGHECPLPISQVLQCLSIATGCPSQPTVGTDPDQGLKEFGVLELWCGLRAYKLWDGRQATLLFWVVVSLPVKLK
jgi:hypothetical protein